MVLTDRDRRVIAAVVQCRVLTREHLTRLGHFASKTRANAVLLRLVRFGYLARRSLPAVAATTRALYYAGPAAHDIVRRPQGAMVAERRQVRLLSDLFLAHQLLITDVYVAFHAGRADYKCLRWMTDEELRRISLGVVPDGHVEYAVAGKQFGAFIEVDRATETLGRFADKVRRYLLLAATGRYQDIFGRPYFRVLVIAENDAHLEHLRRVTAQQTDRVFWFTTHARLLQDHPCASIWRRPVDAAFHSLTEA
jgi:hypothetical protein